MKKTMQKQVRKTKMKNQSMKYRKTYLDGAANTPLDPKVLAVMEEYMKDGYVGNSFSLYDDGIRSMQAVEEARGKISAALETDGKYDIYFTSGATEANNWAIQSACFRTLKERSNKRAILLTATEHSSVLNTAKHMAEAGFEARIMDYPENGVVDAAFVERYLDDKVAIVCVMAVNNETGTINDIRSVAKLCNARKIPFLCDCTQLIGGGKSLKGLNLEDGSWVDYVSFSSHKIYGPTGVGCLVCHKGSPLSPFIVGGAQEYGMRGGTSNTAGIVGFGEAMYLHTCHETVSHFEGLSAYMHYKLKEAEKLYGEGAIALNEPVTDHKAFNICSLRCDLLPDNIYLLDQLIAMGVECSASSACDAESDGVGDSKPSHVLVALGLSHAQINHTVRISFTRLTTEEDIDFLFFALYNIIEKYQGGKNQ